MTARQIEVVRRYLRPEGTGGQGRLVLAAVAVIGGLVLVAEMVGEWVTR